MVDDQVSGAGRGRSHCGLAWLSMVHHTAEAINQYRKHITI